jgi:signal transduction histidine kinase
LSTVWVVMETASALVALLAALLVVGRYRSSNLLRHFALVQAFIVLAFANLLPNVLPALVGRGSESSLLRARLQLVCGVLAAVAFAIAAFAGETRLTRRARAAMLAAPVAIVAPSVGVALLRALDWSVVDGLAPRVFNGLAGILFAVAALGFRARSGHAAEGDVRRFLAFGMIVAAAARLAYVLQPTDLGPRGPEIGDVLRFGFYAVLLVGAVEEIRSYWERTAASEERRRLARDLHDGVAQELAFIATEAIRRDAAPDQLARISAAAERALDESRRAISALSRPLHQPLDEAVAEAAEGVASRTGVPLRLDLATDVEVPAAVREELVRILREAVGNAARHAHAATIVVQLQRDEERILLRVVDDGLGFEQPATTDRYGITSMTERAVAIGGRLSISSCPGGGTTVEVDLPLPLSA